MSTVHVLLPVHDRRALTTRFVECLVAQTHRDFRLVLIDDGSSDGTADAVRALSPDATVIRGNGDWWWAGGLQQGLDHLKRADVDDDDLVLMINDDLTIAPDFLARAVAMMASRPRTFLCAHVARDDGTTRDPGQHFDAVRLTCSPASSPEAINCLPTQGLFATWRDVRAVGDFHPRALPHYLSDYEWTIRAHRKGFRLETSPEIVVRLEPNTTGFHRIADQRFVPFVRKYFSNKSAANPVHWSTFAILAGSRRHVVSQLFTIWNQARRELQRVGFARDGKRT